ncbi:flagellar assembly protein FliH [Halobacillus sp. B23F22_1]|uniref:flagellar assembly protein FliH n=1 Tax=Halobacillus sp. B23F22_1 TaxID=3459514 RepID=UPI00373E9884
MFKKNLHEKRLIQIKPLHVQKEKDEVLKKHQEYSANELLLEAEATLKAAEEKSNDILQQARKEIEQEKESWNKEKERLIKEAEENGFQAGYKSGEELGAHTYSQKIDEVNELIKLANDNYLQKVSSSEEAIVEIAAACAEKILGKELQMNEASFIHVVKKAVEDVKNQPEIKVYVHPDDYPTIHAQKAELEAIMEFQSSLHIIIKETVEKHGCIIESSFGQIDAGLGSQLTELRRKLDQIVQEEKADE